MHNGTDVGGKAGKDYVTSIAENICNLGTDFVKAVADNTSRTRPASSSSAARRAIRSAPTWQKCADDGDRQAASLKLLGKADTNWTQEGTFQAMSGFLAQHDNVDAVGLRICRRLPRRAARLPGGQQGARSRRRAAHRRAGPVLRLGEGQRSELQDLLFVRPELPVALRADRGDDEEGRQGGRRPTSTCPSR